jgi:hypothetical protein
MKRFVMGVQSEITDYSQTINLGGAIPAHDATKGSNSCQRRLAVLPHYSLVAIVSGK